MIDRRRFLARSSLIAAGVVLGRPRVATAQAPTSAGPVSPKLVEDLVAANRNSIWRSPVNVTYWLSVRCVCGTGSP